MESPFCYVRLALAADIRAAGVPRAGGSRGCRHRGAPSRSTGCRPVGRRHVPPVFSVQRPACSSQDSERHSPVPVKGLCALARMPRSVAPRLRVVVHPRWLVARACVCAGLLNAPAAGQGARGPDGPSGQVQIPVPGLQLLCGLGCEGHSAREQCGAMDAANSVQSLGAPAASGVYPGAGVGNPRGGQAVEGMERALLSGRACVSYLGSARSRTFSPPPHFLPSSFFQSASLHAAVPPVFARRKRRRS